MLNYDWIWIEQLSIIFLSRFDMSISKQLLKISPLVAKALRERRPVVSLESTIISHGMPYPHNVSCALEVQDILRKKGVQPATIALMHGKIHIGLSHQQIEQLAKGSNSRKVSRRDIAYVLAQGGYGSTTVSGTMICSALAGIDIFVTGGLGGVHRGYQQTMDVSADLRELGRTPVTVVSAGVKNILDIARTLQYLQTEGVPVVTYGSKYFPAFFAPSSGILSPISIDKIEDIADMLVVQKRLGLQTGTLVAVPNQDTENAQKIEKAIQQALKQAHDQHITGAATTPFLLKRVHQITEGASITSNISLIKHNAQIGATLALHYSKKYNQVFYPISSRPVSPKNKGKLIVIGGSARDYEITVQEKFQLRQSVKGQWRTSFGGVGRNISQVASRLGTQTVFITALGNQNPSEQLRNNIRSYGIELRQVKDQYPKAPTCLVVLDEQKDNVVCISDMDINEALTLESIKQVFFKEQQKKGRSQNDIVVIDANVEVKDQNLLKILKYLNNLGYFIVYECKGRKSNRPALSQAYRYISLLKMNELEAEIFFETINTTQGLNVPKEYQLQWLAKNVGSESKNRKFSEINAIITRGPQSLSIISHCNKPKEIKIDPSKNVKKTTGAGDTMTGTICSLLLQGQNIQKAISYGVVASRMTVQSEGKVSVIWDQLSLQSLQKIYKESKVSQLI